MSLDYQEYTYLHKWWKVAGRGFFCQQEFDAAAHIILRGYILKEYTYCVLRTYTATGINIWQGKKDGIDSWGLFFGTVACIVGALQVRCKVGRCT